MHTMHVGDLDPYLLRCAGAALGLAFGFGGTKLADALPARYGIRHLTTGATRSRRNAAILAISTLCALGVAHMLADAPDVSLARAALLLATNAGVATAVIAAAAIDLEHMILPNELTLGAALACLATSPLRAIGLGGSVAGAVVGLALAYLPFVLYKKLRGQSGMGLGDAKLALTAGAWLGPEGAVFVLFAGALQATLAAASMRAFGLRYDVPESVRAELDDLRARAAAGDADAASMLADDPMAGEARPGTLGMRLPLGPFLALACVEMLLLRRWILEHAFGWLMR